MTSPEPTHGSFPSSTAASGGFLGFQAARRAHNAAAEGLWRVHGGLYDLSTFDHPGGKSFLEDTRGMDVTELFESHHLDIEKARGVLDKNFVRKADWPRESPLTFKSDGFYSYLRSRVLAKIRAIGPGPMKISRIFGDAVAASFVFLMGASAYLRSRALALVGGVAGGFLIGIGHNYDHQKENWRRHYLDLCGSALEVFHVQHVLSHHVYANTMLDLENPNVYKLIGLPIDGSEPPAKGPAPWLIFKAICINALVGALTSPLSFLMIRRPIGFAHYYVLLGMILASRASPVASSRPTAWAVGLWMLAKSATLVFTASAFVNGHHDEVTWRQSEGEMPSEEMKDFGLFQMEVTGDKRETYLIKNNVWRTIVNLTTLSDHTMHHLFPAVDHAYYGLLYPELADACRKFGVRFETRTTAEMVSGMIAKGKGLGGEVVPRRAGWDGRFKGGWVDEAAGFVDAPKKDQ
ncbi:hypothetical protein DFJ74DRAFT_686289 [Hyaloraphidium curvatum]|nr:hypothetical protein DFJ74DRAFT_686289 [Hyaloraphidium curvatum]